MTTRKSTDPADELFDIVNEDGDATGVVKRRADVHRDGDWHRAFHLWVVAGSPDGDNRVLFQRRSSGKDTWPNYLDVAVGGHFRAGETITDVVREIDEEIGIQPDLSLLVYAGRRRAVSIRPDWHDRELQDVYFLAFSNHFPIFKPNSTEIESLVHLSIGDFLALFNGETTSAPALAAPVVADRKLGNWIETEISASDFVPVRDNYWIRGSLAAKSLLSGGSTVSIEVR